MPHTKTVFFPSDELKYVEIFFGPKPDVALLKLIPISEAGFFNLSKGLVIFTLAGMELKMSNRLVLRIIERYDLNKNLDMKESHISCKPSICRREDQ